MFYHLQMLLLPSFMLTNIVFTHATTTMKQNVTHNRHQLLFVLILLVGVVLTQTSTSAGVTTAQKQQLYCPEGWNEFNNNCYWLYLLSVTWQEAIGACQTSKGNLVTFDSLDELNFVLQVVRDRLTRHTQQSTARVWVGLSTLFAPKSRQSFDWVFANATRKTANPQVLKVLYKNLTLPQNNDAEQCGYFDVGRQAPNGIGLTAPCDAPLPASDGTVHGFMCQRQTLPVKGAFYGDLFVPDDGEFSALQHDAVSSKKPVPVAGYWRPTSPVPYKISSEFRGIYRKMIKEALDTLQTHVCGLKFREIMPSDERPKEYLFYEKVATADLCASAVGRVGQRSDGRSSGQIIMLGTECFKPGEPGTIMHETMHSLGVPHEHQRPDRDRYVRVNWDNIIDDRNLRSQFFNYSELLPAWIDVPYDYASIMHYKLTDFSRFGRFPTLIVLQETEVRQRNIIIGQRANLSKHDVEKLVNLFPCDSNGKPIPSKFVIEADAALPKGDRNPFKNPKCHVEFNRDMVSGQALETLGNRPKDECCALCDANPKCRGFAWNDWQNGTCFLKSAAGPLIQMDGVVAGYIIARQNASTDDDRDFTAERCYSLYNTDIHGGEAVGAVNGQYSHSCCRLCEENPKCAAYAWNDYAGGTCWLKSASDRHVVAPGVQSGIVRARVSSSSSSSPLPVQRSNVADRECRMVRSKDIAPNQHLATLTIRRQDECCPLCASTVSCKAFTWNEANGGTCYLKNVSEPLLDNFDMPVAGVLMQDEVTSPTVHDAVSTTTQESSSSSDSKARLCSYQPGYDVAPGATIRSISERHIKQCCRLCQNEPQCRAFTWSIYYNGTCFLKSVNKPLEPASGAVSGFVKR